MTLIDLEKRFRRTGDERHLLSLLVLAVGKSKHAISLVRRDALSKLLDLLETATPISSAVRAGLLKGAMAGLVDQDTAIRRLAARLELALAAQPAPSIPTPQGEGTSQEEFLRLESIRLCLEALNTDPYYSGRSDEAPPEPHLSAITPYV